MIGFAPRVKRPPRQQGIVALPFALGLLWYAGSSFWDYYQHSGKLDRAAIFDMQAVRVSSTGTGRATRWFLHTDANGVSGAISIEFNDPLVRDGTFPFALRGSTTRGILQTVDANGNLEPPLSVRLRIMDAFFAFIFGLGLLIMSLTPHRIDKQGLFQKTS